MKPLSILALLAFLVPSLGAQGPRVRSAPPAKQPPRISLGNLGSNEFRQDLFFELNRHLQIIDSDAPSDSEGINWKDQDSRNFVSEQDNGDNLLSKSEIEISEAAEILIQASLRDPGVGMELLAVLEEETVVSKNPAVSQAARRLKSMVAGSSQEKAEKREILLARSIQLGERIRGAITRRASPEQIDEMLDGVFEGIEPGRTRRRSPSAAVRAEDASPSRQPFHATRKPSMEGVPPAAISELAKALTEGDASSEASPDPAGNLFAALRGKVVFRLMAETIHSIETAGRKARGKDASDAAPLFETVLAEAFQTLFPTPEAQAEAIRNVLHSHLRGNNADLRHRIEETREREGRPPGGPDHPLAEILWEATAKKENLGDLGRRVLFADRVEALLPALKRRNEAIQAQLETLYPRQSEDGIGALIQELLTESGKIEKIISIYESLWESEMSPLLQIEESKNQIRHYRERISKTADAPKEQNEAYQYLLMAEGDRKVAELLALRQLVALEEALHLWDSERGEQGDAIVEIFSPKSHDPDAITIVRNQLVALAKSKGWTVEEVPSEKKNFFRLKISAPDGNEAVFGEIFHEAGFHRFLGLSQNSEDSVQVVAFPAIGILDFEFSEDLLKIRGERAGGPGGQSVNKGNAAVRASFNIEKFPRAVQDLFRRIEDEIEKEIQLSVMVQDKRSGDLNRKRAIAILRKNFDSLKARLLKEQRTVAELDQLGGGVERIIRVVDLKGATGVADPRLPVENNPVSAKAYAEVKQNPGAFLEHHRLVLTAAMIARWEERLAPQEND